MQPRPTTPSRLLPRKYKSYQEDDNSALHLACYRSDYDSALMLLLANHSMEVRNVWGETPLHQCTSQGHLELMMLLLDAGCCVNSMDKDGLTPLHQAIIHGNRDAAELLICYNAKIFGDSGVKQTRSPLELSSHVHVCHQVISDSIGRVWPLQHLCRIAIRRFLGASRRRRLKELPLPRFLLAYLSSLPVAKSDQLHANWERTKSTKSISVKERVSAHRPRHRIRAGLEQLRFSESER